ncbi:MAG: HAD hydrolase family protein, partial [Rhodospirillales bacterium]
VAHIGDDLNDLPLLGIVGVSLTVADAAAEVLRAVDYVTKKKGGDGAVREVCDLIVAARG